MTLLSPERPVPAGRAENLLTLDGLSTEYHGPHGPIRAVDDVSITVAPGETVALVGESGCGKSTLGKTLMRLVPATSGRIGFRGRDVTRLEGAALREMRQGIQMIFQDPFASLNPRQTIRTILTAPLARHGIGPRAHREELAHGIVAQVGLPADSLDRYPHEFSGGQRQRIGIARALILNPALVVCDEPVSALDLSIQAQILNLLAALKAERGLSYLFISHDLSVVRWFADRVLVMYLGRIVEEGDTTALWTTPRHPYTRALMEAVPDPTRRRHAAPLPGDLPGLGNLPTGCRFRTRCPLATELCAREEPRLGTGSHRVACHHA